jgi:hypothetical protein
MEREIGRWMRLQFIHLLGESQWPPFRSFESASICVYLRLFSLSTAGFRLNGPFVRGREKTPGEKTSACRASVDAWGDWLDVF